MGPSGCGKSTILQLAQRLYDVEPIEETSTSGIFLDGHDLHSLAPAWIREHIAIVSQEPKLFDLTIGENIAYGVAGDRSPTMDTIIEAAKQANIHDFIETLPQVTTSS